MPEGADQSLDILIRILTDKVGGEEAKRIIAQVKAESVESGEKGAAAAEKHGGSVRGLHRALSMLGHGFGEIGRLIHFAFYGPVAAALAVVAVMVHRVVKHMEELKQKAEETRKELAAFDAATFEGLIKGMTDARQAASDWAAFMKTIHETTATLKTDEEYVLAKLKAQNEERKKDLELRKQSELAAAKGDPVATAEIERRYGRKESAQELKNEAARLKTMEAALTIRKQEAAALLSSAATAETAVEKGPPEKKGIPKLREEVSQASGKMKELEERVRKADEDIEKFKASRRDVPGLPFSEAQIQAMIPASKIEALTKAQGELTEARKKVFEGTAEIQKYDAEVRRRQDALKKVQPEAEAAQKDVAARERELETARTVYEIHRGGVGLRTTREGLGTLLKSGATPPDLFTGLMGAAVGHGLTRDQAQRKWDETQRGGAKAIEELLDQIVAYLVKMNTVSPEKIANLSAIIARLESRTTNIEKQVPHH